MTVKLEGPGIHKVTRDAVALFQRVVRGNWGAVVDVTEDRLRDPDDAREQFDALATGLALPPAPEAAVTGSGDEATFVGPTEVLLQAMDLYMRVLMGQFNRLADVCGYWPELGDACDRMRFELQRKDTWPDHPRTYLGIHSPDLPRQAFQAYEVWKLLGGGMPDRQLRHIKVKVVIN